MNANRTKPLEPSEDEKRTEVTMWVDIYGDELYSWACCKVAEVEVAQDIVQETFLSALQSYNSFRHESSPKTWLFSILNNKIANYYRAFARNAVKTGREIEKTATGFADSLFTSEGTWTDPNSTPWDSDSSLLDDAEFTGILSRCMEKLPASWLAVVRAKYLLEKDSKQICQELDISPTNYWQVLHRAKLSLKKCIELQWFK